jgi:lactate permease
VWPACLTAGLSFAIVQFLVEMWRFDDDPPVEEELTARRRSGPATGQLSPGPGAVARSELSASSDRREAFMAWLPWILLAVLVFLWGTPRSSRS